MRQSINGFLDLLLCPRTGSSLELDSNGALTANNQTYPQTGGIPWLFPEPEANLWHWRASCREYIQQLKGAVLNMKSVQKDKSLREGARRRLARRLQATVEQIKFVESILEPLGIDEAGSIELSAVMRAQLPSTQGISSYYDNIHRDWGWDSEIPEGENENTHAVSLISELMAGSAMASTEGATVLVLGAGACRLSWDLHNKLKFGRTLNLDINPMLLLAGERIVSGKSVKLYEFPISPLDEYSVAVLRKLKAPDGTAESENFSYIFGDGTNPPVKAGVFDIVLTPWFVDIVPMDMHELIPRINRALKPGGLWLNFGSLAFLDAGYARRYSKEELFEAAAEFGFAKVNHLQRKIPYMCSPASAHGRRELVLASSAVKVAETSFLTVKTWLPSWLVDHSQAVPVTPEMGSAQQTHAIYADILSLVDGKRSLQEIAQETAGKFGLNPEDAKYSLARMFTKIVQDSRQGTLT